MGLTTWKGPRLRKTDASVAKNYLTATEVSDLNLLTTQFLDFADSRARRRQTTSMADWVAQTDRFIDFNEYPLLTDAGRISASRAEQIVADRFTEFDRDRRAREAERAITEEAADLDALLEAGQRLAPKNDPEEHRRT